MTSETQQPRRSVRSRIVKYHRWLGLGAALFWLVQAITGTMLSFHFELEDAALTTAHRPTDPAAIERTIDGFASAGGNAGVTWIWTTAGLPDRYIILFSDPGGTMRKAYIDGAGDVLRDRRADDYSFLGLMREIHLTLVAGTLGHWLLAVSGLLLVTNLIFGVVTAWPRKGQWRSVLKPVGTAGTRAGLYSWHRAVGMWAAAPAIVIAATGTLILLEQPLRDLAGVPDITLPANPPAGPGVGFAAASRAAVEAIPGSRFVGTAFPSAEDASYYAWVRAPGELYRGGYGGSLVIVDANTGGVRGAWPATEADPAQAAIGAFYPLHTGESLGTPGRIMTMTVGLWLTVTILLGVTLWLRRRPTARG
ncbi:PepSY-associated TM helix domain-containing protein [Sphingosinicella soli]|uniref:Putative iron-regulated membrane protein n=1 Tax=Sphingosinicella soli TaxID=333708 RepID=A0A7W7B0M7_9SPHN|nr:PepSY-associated TM helix domain-containing protein [Sphingosinicella soli]MBB4630873.1 putative iron-regulated membrane protein [Sphingosinicella soli]